MAVSKRMMKVLEFIAFDITFIGAYLAINYYVISRIAGLFGGDPSALWISLVLAVSFPLAYYFEKRAPGGISRLFFTLASTWAGIVFITFAILIIYEISALLIAIPARTAGIAVLAVALSLSAYAIVNGFIIRVKTVDIPIGKMKRTLRLVQISDLHLGSIRNGPFLDRVAHKVNALRPDAVVITGDLVDGSAPVHKGMVEAVDDIDAPVFFVTGNHEWYEGIREILPILRSTRMRLLNDKVVVFKGVQLAGIDYGSGKHAAAVLRRLRIDKKRPSVLLYHVPHLYKEADAKGIDLQLSGHTHNGQVWPFMYLDRIAHRYVVGLHKVGRMRIYVSPGTGMWGPPMRLGSHNEITLHILRKA